MTEGEEFATRSTVGERLRAARQEKGVSLEEVAKETRIPRRHLESLEAGDWSRLPAPTYTIGFAKSYASVVGVDRDEVADQLRYEMGSERQDSAAAEVFEPVDPARTMPKWLVLGAIAAIVVVVVVMSWLSNRSLEPAQEPTAPVATSVAPGQGPAPPQVGPATPPPPAQGPVVLTATEPAWIHVTDQGRTLYQGLLNTGQTYQVPPTANTPMLRAGKPEALRVTVGGTAAPPVGEPGRVASNVSLAPADLMRGGAGSGPATPQPTVPAPSAPPGVQNTTG